MTADHSDEHTAAERIYAEFRRRLDSEEGLELEELCHAHPRLEAELRGLDEEWQRIERLLPPAAASVVPAAQVRAEGREQYASLPVFERLRRRDKPFERYRMQGEVARGGMGAILRVWDEDLQRTLAMKVVLGSDGSESSTSANTTDPKILRRFLEEARVTGQLDHPGIVPVHELGLDDQGSVYFTMRLVQGRELRQIIELVHAEEEDWTLTRALGVVQKVCEAMAFAHDRGVIHRDLKPANVMVGRFGEVYVMDWGLARVLGEEDQKDIRLRRESAAQSHSGTSTEASPDASLCTMDGDVIGTPAYMSPEQARGEVHDLDTRTDVYSVGALLYNLLTGQVPYSARIESPHVILERVLDGPVEPVHEAARDVPAELCAICEKAMARERSERYPDMLALAEDLRAYLENRVVQAHRTGAVVEFKKWVGRNRALAATLLAAITLAVGGSTTAAVVLAAKNEEIRLAKQDADDARDAAETREGEAILAKLDATEARNQAETNAEAASRERQAADRVVDFLVDLFESPTPEFARGERVTAKEVLDRGVARIEAGLKDDALVQARLMVAMGQAYQSLGRYREAEPLLRTSLETRSRLLGEEHELTLGALAQLGELLMTDGRYLSAAPLLEGALKRTRAALGEDDPLTLYYLNNLGTTYLVLGRYEESEELLLACLEKKRAIFESEDPEILVSMSNLAYLHQEQGRFKEAEELHLEVLDVRRRVLGEEHPDTLTTLNNLGLLYKQLGRFEESETFYGECLDKRHDVLGAEHPMSLLALGNLAGMYQAEGRLEEAEPMMIEGLDVCRRVLGDDHPITLMSLNNLGLLYIQQNRLDLAEPMSLECAKKMRAAFGDHSPYTLMAVENAASVHFRRGRLGEAESLFVECLEARVRSVGREHARTKTVLNFFESLALAYEREKRHEDAVRVCRRLLEWTPAESQAHARRTELLERVVAAQK